MFDVNQFFNAPHSDETTTVCRGAEEFKIKRLDGVERLQFSDKRSAYDKTIYVLARCLLSGEPARPIGEENAVKFVERFSTLSDALFSDILDFTNKTLEKETEIWAAAKKNSPTSPDSKIGAADTVAGTV